MPSFLPNHLPPAASAVLVASGLLLLVIVSFPLWRWLLGPVFAYETTRLARQGKVVLMRCAYALALFAAFYAVFPSESQFPSDDKGTRLNRFADEFSQVFLLVQASVVCLLTPIYVAGAVSDEKEKRSLDFLLASPLRNREIVLGKLAARLLHLFGLLLCGLPILAVTQLWGGVDLLTLLGGFAATASQVLSLGAFAMLCSVIAQRTVQATIAAYVIPLVVAGALLPMVTDARRLKGLPEPPDEATRVERLAERTATIVGVNGLVAAICLYFAVRELRRFAAPPEPLRHPLLPLPKPEPDNPLPETVPDSPAATTLAENLSPPMIVPAALPPLGNSNPLLWKETYQGRSPESGLLVYMLWFCYGVIVLAMGVVSRSASGFAEGIKGSEATTIFFAFLVFPALTLLVGVAYRLAGSVTREREQRTLESLLTLPVSRWSLLRAKWLGSLLSFNMCLIAFSLTLLIGVLARALHPLSGLLWALAFGVQTVFAGNLALFLSVYCRSTVRAHLFMFLILLGLLGGTWLLELTGRTDMHFSFAGRAVHGSILDILNPMQAWWKLTFGWERVPPEGRPIDGALAGVALYAAAALALGLAAAVRFRHETGTGRPER